MERFMRVGGVGLGAGCVWRNTKTQEKFRKARRYRVFSQNISHDGATTRWCEENSAGNVVVLFDSDGECNWGVKWKKWLPLFSFLRRSISRDDAMA
jgi:hypothetical protein